MGLVARRTALGRARDRSPGVLFLALTWLVLVVVAVAVGLRHGRDAPPRGESRPASEEDVVVEQWWRRESPAANIRGCRNTGVADPVVFGQVWMCRLWYLGPQDARTVCVSLGEHVVYRRVRAGDLPGDRLARCE